MSRFAPLYRRFLGVALATLAIEPVLCADQLISGGSGGIAAAAALTLGSNPTDGQTLVFTDGTWTLTCTCKDTPVDPTDVQIGATADDTLANAATVINSQETIPFTASVATTLGSIGTQVLLVVAPDTATTYRLFGTASGFGYLDCSSGYAGKNGDVATIPASDPGAGEGTFGFARATAALQPNESHYVRLGDSQQSWDSDGQTWASVSVALAADPGLEFSAGALRAKVGDGIARTSGGLTVDLATNGGLEFSGGKLQGKAGAGLALDSDGFNVQVSGSCVRIQSGSIQVASSLDLYATIGSPTTATLGDPAPLELALPFDHAGGAVRAYIGIAGPFYCANGTSEKSIADFFFSPDDGTTAKALNAITSTDEICWIPRTTNGGNLQAGDVLKVQYTAFV